MNGKDIFPYNFLDSVNKFDTLIHDIKHTDFYNILTKTNITTREYATFKSTCRSAAIKTLGEWHDLYLMKDVLLLADFFENPKLQFRPMSLC